MKNFISGLVALSLLVSCSSKEDVSSFGEQTSYEIFLKSGVHSVDLVKAGPINSNFDQPIPIGIYAYNTAWKAGSTANVINNDLSTVQTSGNVTFGSGPYYYPSDGSTVYFFAFAPQGTEVAAAGAGSSPVVGFGMTGQEDIMWASATGYRSGSSPAVQSVLNFQHLLTQLQFTFKAGTGYPASGNKVISLTVNAQPDSVTMSVESGACTFIGSTDMQILSTADQSAGIEITSAGTDAQSPVITRISSGSSAYLLTIVVQPNGAATPVTYSNIPLNLTTVAGTAHMITITFAGTAIALTAEVADWQTDGEEGSVTIPVD